MALKFFNIRSREVQVAITEPQISALWASSDRSPNAHQGQDFGWRLAPEVVVELKRIKKDADLLEKIATKYKLPLDAIDEKVILRYISSKSAVVNAPVAEETDYTDEYNEEIRRLESGGKPRRTRRARKAKETQVNP